MYIDSVPNRNSPPAVLLRESYWENGKVKKRTLANLSCLDPVTIDLLKRSLKGESFVSATEAFSIVQSKPHGHVQAVMAAMKKLGLPELIASKSGPQRDLVLAMIAARIISPKSKLGTSAIWNLSALAAEFKVEGADENDLYDAMDWLVERQDKIENKLTRRLLQPGDLAYYDLSSSYVEGECCPLAQYGYSRDKKRGNRQINYGLLTDKRRRPISIKAWPGNTSDTTTFLPTVEKVRHDFGLETIVMVGDRGMLGSKNIEIMKAEKGIDWITALRSTSIRGLVESGNLQLSLFDENNLCEFNAPGDFPGERLIACRNPFLADKRAHAREKLLSGTEKNLEKIRSRVEAGRLQRQDAIGLAVGRVIDKHHLKKHFELKIEDDSFLFSRKDKSIAAEAVLDGIYIVRTSIAPEKMNAEDCVRNYKKLSQVERAFRTMKSIGEKVRPIYHYTESRVRAHLFLCMLAYYVEWHMREAWRELTFADEELAQKETRDPVAPAQSSDSAKQKATKRTTRDGFPVLTFAGILTNLATIDFNICQATCNAQNTNKELSTFSTITQASTYQQRALKLIQSINPAQ
jgi:transposase